MEYCNEQFSRKTLFFYYFCERFQGHFFDEMKLPEDNLQQFNQNQKALNFMSEQFQKKTSSILVTGLISVIVISFMFSGYESMKGSPDTIAKVDDKVIKYREFQAEFDRQLQFYSQMFGGQPLTSLQIESFNIKSSVINNLVNRKLIMILSENLGITPSPDQIKKEIKELPYFQTGGQFDFEKYKIMLANARFTPQDFENDISEQLRGQMLQGLMTGFPLSQNLSDDLVKFKKEIRKAHLIQFRKNALKETLPVSDAEVSAYLAKNENEKKLKSMFEGRKKSLDQPEQIKARHILLSSKNKKEADLKKQIDEIRKKVTVKNFVEMANKYGEDPSGKSKGGDLGWFPHSQMVPEFEKVAFSMKPGEISAPVKTQFGYHVIYVEDHRPAKIATFEENKKNLAMEFIREGKTKELEEANLTLKKNLEKFLKEGKILEIEKLQKTAHFTFEKNVTLNRFDGAMGGITLDGPQVNDIFSAEKAEKTYELPSQITLIKTWTAGEKEVETLKIDPEKESQTLKLALSRKLNEDLLEKLKEKSNVKIYNVMN